MRIIKDLLTAVKGGLSDVGESIVDANAIKILRQEIREAEEAIQTAKQSLSKLKADEIGMKKELSSLNEDINDYTAKAKGALTKGDEALARKIAGRIQELTTKKSGVEDQQTALANQVEKIYAVIKQRESGIRQNRLELQKAETYENLQKTQRVVAAAMPTNDSSAKRVSRALDRVKKKQSDIENEMDADQWLADLEAGNDLDKEIANAGLDENSASVDDILASLKGDNGK